MNQLATKETSPVAQFSRYMDRFKPQMALALPKHLNADRMARLAVSEFSKNPVLQKCAPDSIAASIMTASTLGLEIGVNGQAFLVPYKDWKRGMIAQCIPGWKGLQDIANRSGRCTTWTGAVFEGDEFDYAMGDRPFIKHRPGDSDNEGTPTHVYAVGRVVGSDWPVIDVWPISKVYRHLTKYNKQGDKHYGLKNIEMYGRKVVLLQVLKYMPASIEMSKAVDLANAQDGGKHAIIEGDFVTVSEGEEEHHQQDSGIAMPTAKAAAKEPAKDEDEIRKDASEHQGHAGTRSVDELTGKPSDAAIKALKTKLAFKKLTLIDACEGVGVSVPNSIEDLSLDAFTAVREWTEAQ